MKLTKVDKLGRVVIPKGYRKALNLTENSLIEISLIDGKILIDRHICTCKLCGKPIESKGEIQLCPACISAVKSL